MAVGVEMESVDEVVAVVPGLELPKPRNGGDAHIRSGIQFLSLTRCSILFDFYEPYGTYSIWYHLVLLGLTSCGMAISEIFHVALRVEHVTLRPLGG